MNRKGLELAISTIILIVLGVLVLAGLIVYLRGGFKILDNTKPITDSLQGAATKEACNIACKANDRLTFCCHEFDVNKEKINCIDTRLEIECGLVCEDFVCQNGD